MTCPETRMALGAYVVGALDDAERAEVRRHVETCRSCRQELAELSGVPRLLATLTLAEAEQGPAQPDEDLLTRLLSRVAGERARMHRRRSILALAAAVVMVALVATLVGVMTTRGTTTPPAPPVAASSPSSASPTALAVEVTDPRTGAWAKISATPAAWGTRLHLELAGVPAGERCRLVAVGADGTRETAASWAVPAGGYAKGGGALRVDGAVAMPAGQIQKYVVETFAGQRLLQVAA